MQCESSLMMVMVRLIVHQVCVSGHFPCTKRILLYHSHPISASRGSAPIEQVYGRIAWLIRDETENEEGLSLTMFKHCKHNWKFIEDAIETIESCFMQMTCTEFKRGTHWVSEQKEGPMQCSMEGRILAFGEETKRMPFPHHLWSPKWERRRARPARAMFSERKGLALLLQGSQYIFVIQCWWGFIWVSWLKVPKFVQLPWLYSFHNGQY